MLQFALRCVRVPLRMGKTIRHAMRHHVGLSHHVSHHVFHVILGSMLVCTVVPGALWLLPPAAGPPTPPSGVFVPVPNAGGDVAIVPVPLAQPGDSRFVPGLFYFPHTTPREEPAEQPRYGSVVLTQAGLPVLASEDSPASGVSPHILAEPTSLLLLVTGLAVLLVLRRRAR
jgi:hypothetical protein